MTHVVPVDTPGGRHLAATWFKAGEDTPAFWPMILDQTGGDTLGWTVWIADSPSATISDAVDRARRVATIRADDLPPASRTLHYELINARRAGLDLEPVG